MQQQINLVAHGLGTAEQQSPQTFPTRSALVNFLLQILCPNESGGGVHASSNVLRGQAPSGCSGSNDSSCSTNHQSVSDGQVQQGSAQIQLDPRNELGHMGEFGAGDGKINIDAPNFGMDPSYGSGIRSTTSTQPDLAESSAGSSFDDARNISEHSVKEVKRQKLHRQKLCQIDRCDKYVQGGTSYCCRHGGKRICKHTGCTKIARDKKFCCAHGGGQRCVMEGCTTMAVGRTRRCTKHGGGRRCTQSGCNTGAQGVSAFCIKHGGGYHCVFEGCDKVARGGQNGLCSQHYNMLK